jgi:hypothetical protein
MKIIQTTTPIFVYTIENHLEHKDILLNAINLFIESQDTELDEHSTGTNTTIQSDWNLTRGDYLQYFYKHIVPQQIIEITKSLHLENWSIDNGWFQQYTELSEHTWHTHPNTQFTNVYYLELPDNSYKTEVKDINNNIIEFDAKEGDILTIPSHLVHRSKPNSNKRKTIISYNSSFCLHGN